MSLFLATITAEIQSVNSDQVTITRTSDGQEFTIPLSMLDEASSKEVERWRQAEAKRQYFPDTRPFYQHDGEMIIPLGLDGNELTYLNAAGQRATKAFDTAPMLRELVEANKSGLGTANTGAFQNPEYIYTFKGFSPERQFAFDDRLAVVDDPTRELGKSPRWEVYLIPEAMREHRLWVVTYEIYWIDIRNVPVGAMGREGRPIDRQ